MQSWGAGENSYKLAAKSCILSVMATVKIPPVLRAAVGGEKQVNASGSSIGEVLRDLISNHPSTKNQLFSADDKLNRYVNVYLNGEDVRVLNGLETAVEE